MEGKMWKAARGVHTDAGQYLTPSLLPTSTEHGAIKLTDMCQVE